MNKGGIKMNEDELRRLVLVALIEHHRVMLARFQRVFKEEFPE